MCYPRMLVHVLKTFTQKKHDISLFKVCHGVRFCEKMSLYYCYTIAFAFDSPLGSTRQDSLLWTCLLVKASSCFVKECVVFVNPSSVMKGKQWLNCFYLTCEN